MSATRPAPVTSASLALEVESRLRSRHICADPAAAARLCMEVVLPVLRGMAARCDERDAENERLQKLVAEYVVSGKKRSEGEERHG
jgi:hypothetical protein